MCQKFYFPQRSMRSQIPAIERANERTSERANERSSERLSRSKYARKIFHRLQTQIKQEPRIYWFSEAAAFNNDTKLISIYFTTRNEQLRGSAREAVCRRRRNRMIINKIVLIYSQCSSDIQRLRKILFQMEKEKSEVFRKAVSNKRYVFLKNVEIDSCKQSATRCPAVGTVWDFTGKTFLRKPPACQRRKVLVDLF